MHSDSILNKVETHAVSFLKKIFPDDRHYHNLTHTLEVVNVSVEIAKAEKLNADEIEIIKIAAWFHDLGYLCCCEGHEEQSSFYAREFLVKEFYPPDKIDMVIGCINATKVPQSPSNKIEAVLCDADLHHFGLIGSAEKGELLRQEIELKGIKKFTELEWLKTSAAFLKQHQYFTDYAKHKYNPQKKINISILENKISRIEENRNPKT